MNDGVMLERRKRVMLNKYFMFCFFVIMLYSLLSLVILVHDNVDVLSLGLSAFSFFIAAFMFFFFIIDWCESARWKK